MPRLRYRYHTHVFHDHDIHLRTLRDNQQFLDVGGEAENRNINSASWPLFGVVWDSSQVLAHLLSDYAIQGKRILEMGCGIGLPSMLLNHRDADITASDYHPQAGVFLSYNTQLNDEKDIPFYCTDWCDEDSGMGSFDLLLGSDILYEQDHVGLLAGFIDRHARLKAEVILVDPGRRQHARFSKQMVLQGFAHHQERPALTGYLDKPFKGQVLQYRRGDWHDVSRIL